MLSEDQKSPPNSDEFNRKNSSNTPKTKRCISCSQLKPIEEFYKNIPYRKRDDTLVKYRISYCKACKHEMTKKYQQQHKDRYKQRRSLEKRKIIIHTKTARQTHLEKWLEYERKKKREKDRRMIWAERTLAGHKHRGCLIKIEKNTLFKLAVMIKNCPLCGNTLAWSLKDSSGKINNNSPTLDIIDPKNNSFLLENVQIICWFCNRAKSSKSMKEFKDYCQKVVENTKTTFSLFDLEKRFSQQTLLHEEKIP